MSRKLIGAGLLAAAILGGWQLGHWAARAGAGGWFAARPAQTAGPSAVVPQTERDFGTVSQGTVLKATFPVTNRGSQRLILRERSQPCCGESGDGREIIVAAAASQDIEIEVDTALWQGDLRHTARFESNDPRLPELNLVVRAVVDARQP